jgi:hypothetical protein
VEVVAVYNPVPVPLVEIMVAGVQAVEILLHRRAAQAHRVLL